MWIKKFGYGSWRFQFTVISAALLLGPSCFEQNKNMSTKKIQQLFYKNDFTADAVLFAWNSAKYISSIK